jgi:hypothetical protein
MTRTSDRGIREQLGIYLSTAHALTGDFAKRSPAEIRDRKGAWEATTNAYLRDHLDSSYQSRFDNTNPAAMGLAVPSGLPESLHRDWVDLFLKTILLQQFMDQLKD